MCLKENNII